MAWRGTVTCSSSGSGSIPIPLYVGTKGYTAQVASSLTFSVDTLKMWAGEYTSTQTHALDALPLLDDNGDNASDITLNFLVVYAIWVENASTNSTALITCGAAAGTQFIGTGGLGQATATQSLRPGDGRWIHINKDGLSTSGAEDFKVALSGASGKYRIVVFGTT